MKKKGNGEMLIWRHNFNRLTLTIQGTTRSQTSKQVLTPVRNQNGSIHFVLAIFIDDGRLTVLVFENFKINKYNTMQ